jgi:hypothetical protein
MIAEMAQQVNTSVKMDLVKSLSNLMQ